MVARGVFVMGKVVYIVHVFPFDNKYSRTQTFIDFHKIIEAYIYLKKWNNQRVLYKEYIERIKPQKQK